MLKRLIVSKYQQSTLYYHIMAKKVVNFYRNALTQRNIPNIPYTFLRHEFHIMDYLWDIHEEISVLESIDEDTTDLKVLYSQLQVMRNYAI